MADITMPQLGETVTEGTITKWLKSVGDAIAEDEALFEVSTDKVDSEVPSTVSGFVTEILVPEGDTVEVGAKLAVISDSADGAGGGGGSTEEAAPAATEEAKAEASAPQAEPEASPAEGDSEGGDAGVTAAEAEQAGATEEEANAEAAPETSNGNGAAPAQAAPKEEAKVGASSGGGGDGGGGAGGGGGADGRILSPVVRKLIAENNLDPSSIEGTGAGGRITRNDVLAFLDNGGASKAAAPATAPAAAPAAKSEESAAPAPAAKAAPAAAKPTGVPAKAGVRDESVAFSNIRKRTAEHMRRSLDTSAHTLVVIEVDYENIDKVRSKVKSRFKEEHGVSLSYLPFIARATVDAIAEFPHVNASVGENELIVHNYVNLGIAVDLNYEGLIVPVVHDAGDLRLSALARAIADLAGKARSKKLTADEIQGGTFTITNAGGYGTLITGPIINQPQVAILSTDGVKPKPVAIPLPDGGYGIAVHPIGNLAISFDHRAYDGAYASAFLAKLREILETRDWATEL
jgi:2-oxoglutarate dehydrogenase E2 component (dihydrolipoamide succinyltransferase)